MILDLRPVCRVQFCDSQHLFLHKGIACVGAGLILVFQSTQTYVVDAFTLHAASGTFHLLPFIHSFIGLLTSCNYNVHISYSPRCSFIPPLSRGFRLPPVCSGDVRETGVRKRRHHPRMSGHRPRVSCVRPLTYHSDYTLRNHIDVSLKHFYSPVFLWKYGRRIRASSRYAHKGQMRSAPSAPGASVPPPTQAVGKNKQAEMK